MSKISQRFDVYYDKLLGKGGFGEVFLGWCRDMNTRVAVKVIKKQELRKRGTNYTLEIEKEVLAMQTLDHPNIMKFYDLFEERDCFELCIELIEGGDLFDRIIQIQRYTERNAQEACRSILAAMRHMHQRGVVHRDLKPENFMLRTKSSNFDILIVDFGLSATGVTSNSLQGLCGTLEYHAPEMLSAFYYGKPVDMWALGVVVYCMMSGTMPFGVRNIKDKSGFHVKTNILSGRLTFPDERWSHVSAEAKDFIQGLLCMSPDRRLTAAQALNHTWIHLSAETLEAHDLSTNVPVIKSLTLRKKMRKVVHSIMAVQKFQRLLPPRPQTKEAIAQQQQQQPQAPVSSEGMARMPSGIAGVGGGGVVSPITAAAAALHADDDEVVASTSAMARTASRAVDMGTGGAGAGVGVGGAGDGEDAVRLLSALARTVSSASPLNAAATSEMMEPVSILSNLTKQVSSASRSPPTLPPYPGGKGGGGGAGYYQDGNNGNQDPVALELLQIRQAALISEIAAAEQLLQQFQQGSDRDNSDVFDERLIQRAKRLQAAILEVSALIAQVKRR